MQYAIADIGSNTIVLLVYEMENHIPKPILHISTPAHLIDDVDENKVMSKQGIQKATTILNEYAKKLDEMHIHYRWADITEPCRIQNQNELVQSLRSTSWQIYPLTGEQEASYDFLGVQYSYPDLKDGIAFDVGGGSTELISYQDGKPIDAMSFPLGCVRLAHLPLDTPQCKKYIQEAQQQYPSLDRICKRLIGIGGTVRAAGKVYTSFYPTSSRMQVNQLEDIYAHLVQKDERYVQAMQANVGESRQKVFLPGLHMVLEIARIYQAESILISSTGIREGFLTTRLHEEGIL